LNVQSTKLPGVLILEPTVHRDERGFFLETYQAERYKACGIDANFVQDNHSCSPRGVLRGMHAQRKHPQGKLVRVVCGEVFDVAVDINPASDSFGQWVGVHLTEENQHQMWIPPSYAHGFVVLSDVADFEYKCTDYYYPEDEYGLVWNDPQVAIDWPLPNPVLKDKDRLLPTLEELQRQA